MFNLECKTIFIIRFYIVIIEKLMSSIKYYLYLGYTCSKEINFSIIPQSLINK